MRSGGCFATMASASSPQAAVEKRKPSDASMTSSNCLLWGSSSTIRMRAGWAAVSGGGVECISEVCSSLHRRRRQVRRDDRQEILVRERLGDVAVAARGANALLVALHREGGERNH